jgi:alpha-L-fucosidase 2
MAAAVAEMVLQSHENELAFLPALPDSWKDGEVKGLVARGGFEVGLRWTAGLLQHATIFSKIGNTCRIRSDRAFKVVSGNKTVRVTKPEKDVWEFKTAPGASYKLTYIK